MAMSKRHCRLEVSPSDSASFSRSRSYSRSRSPIRSYTHYGVRSPSYSPCHYRSRTPLPVRSRSPLRYPYFHYRSPSRSPSPSRSTRGFSSQVAPVETDVEVVDELTTWRGYSIYRSSQNLLDEIYAQRPSMFDNFRMRHSGFQALILKGLAHLIEVFQGTLISDLQEADISSHLLALEDLSAVGLDVSFLQNLLNNVMSVQEVPKLELSLETIKTKLHDVSKERSELVQRLATVDGKIEDLGLARDDTISLLKIERARVHGLNGSRVLLPFP